MKKRNTCWILSCVLLLIVAGCTLDEGSLVFDNPNGVFRTLAAEESGIVFSNNLSPTSQVNIVEYLYYYNGGGVAIGDVNSDGLEDIYLTGNQCRDRLYINKGDLLFEDVTDQAQISNDSSWSSGVSIVDVNSDGLLDIYVCKVSPISADMGYNSRNVLYINQGDLKFQEMADQFGLDFAGYSTQAAWLDYDRDGDLDMYLLNHTVHSVTSYGTISNRSLKDSLSGDRLYENRLDTEGQFVDVSDSAGIYSSPLGYGLAVTVADLNADGWQDIYVGNDFHENDYIYINQGDGTFVESVGEMTAHTSQFSMGVDVNDINGDGYLDIFTTDMLPYDATVALQSGGADSDEVQRIKRRLGYEDQYARNHLQLFDGISKYSDVALMTGTYATDWSWSVLLQDFDRNGQTDIFTSNGIVRRPNDLDYINYLNTFHLNDEEDPERYKKLVDQMPMQPLRNMLMLQSGEMEFKRGRAAEIGEGTFSTGAAYADLDRDGDLDIVLNNINDRSTILENTTESGHYLAVALVGSEDYPVIIGTRLLAYQGDRVYTGLCSPTKGFQSSSSHHVTIGLPEETPLDSLVVYWPDGAVQRLFAVQIDTIMSISKASEIRGERITSSYAAATEIKPKHVENAFNDDVMQSLTPSLLSREGPGSLVEDLNGDGYVDFYRGGARGAEAVLYRGSADGSFSRVEVTAFSKDAKYEDVDVASIDFDNDGDLDLYVVSGGNEANELDKLLEDRLYLNNGDLDYRRVPLSLPHTNGSTVSIADLDQDGYEDIFVGARSIPKAYGLSPYSFVLGNKGGQRLEILLRNRLGMLTDSEWTDIDGDGDQDLIVVGDWMAPRLFVNNQGDLQEQELLSGRDSLVGMWSCIEIADLNQDGRPDVLLGNIGRNHMWTATPTEPLQLYVGDFDDNGATEPLLFGDYFGTNMPLQSLDQLKISLPILRKRFTTYEQFANVQSLEDMHSDFASKVLESRAVTELSSVVLWSHDSGYRVEKLPSLAQNSIIGDFVVNEDGLISYVGNADSYTSHYGEQSAHSFGQLRWNSEEEKIQVVDGPSINPYLTIQSLYLLSDGRYLLVPNNDYPLIIR